jgi:hypothetical protein
MKLVNNTLPAYRRIWLMLYNLLMKDSEELCGKGAKEKKRKKSAEKAQKKVRR